MRLIASEISVVGEIGETYCNMFRGLSSDDRTNFEIHAQNIPCGSGGVTCTKQVDIHLYTPDHIHISLLRGREMTVNGQEQVRILFDFTGSSFFPMV